ncbi:MAG: TIGR04282 family arsenosugar biosynthesis glycosyltransferase [Hyphomicrobium sp.]
MFDVKPRSAASQHVTRATRRANGCRGPTVMCRLVIMAKEPRMGRVKSRLARDIGVVAATHMFRQELSSTVARLTCDRRWQTLLAVAPDGARHSRLLPGGLMRMGQGRGDLGQRMAHVMATAPRGPLLIIGADVPGVRPAVIARAFRLLASHDGVIGPSPDGGYWLIGLKARTRANAAFASVRWSTPNARSDTLANLDGQRIAHADTLSDLDDGEDVVRLGATLGRRVLPR